MAIVYDFKSLGHGLRKLTNNDDWWEPKKEKPKAIVLNLESIVTYNPVRCKTAKIGSKTHQFCVGCGSEVGSPHENVRGLPCKYHNNP